MHTHRLKKLADWLTDHNGLIKFDLCTWQTDALYYCVKVWENDWTWNNALMPVINAYEDTRTDDFVKRSAIEWFGVTPEQYSELFFPGTQTIPALKFLQVNATPVEVAHNIYAFIELNQTT